MVYIFAVYISASVAAGTESVRLKSALHVEIIEAGSAVGEMVIASGRELVVKNVRSDVVILQVGEVTVRAQRSAFESAAVQVTAAPAPHEVVSAVTKTRDGKIQALTVLISGRVRSSDELAAKPLPTNKIWEDSRSEYFALMEELLNSPSILGFLVERKVSENLYEIREIIQGPVGKKSVFNPGLGFGTTTVFGDVPSPNPALLFTVRTSFSSGGQAILPVNFIEDRKMKSAAGFDLQVQVYREAINRKWEEIYDEFDKCAQRVRWHLGSGKVTSKQVSEFVRTLDEIYEHKIIKDSDREMRRLRLIGSLRFIQTYRDGLAADRK